MTTPSTGLAARSRTVLSPLSLRLLGVATAIGLGAFAAHQLAPWIRLPSSTGGPVIAGPSALPVPPLPELPKGLIPGVDVAEATGPIPLVVTATLPGRNASEGAATIGTRAETAQTFGIGALLPNGARLQQVFADRIVLVRGGDRAVLFIDPSRPPELRLGPQRGDQIADSNDLIQVRGGPTQAEIKASPAGVASQIVRTQPVFADNEVRGFRLSPGDRPSQFASLGLQSGDILIAFDGVRVSVADQAEGFLGALNSTAPVAVTVDRNGQLEHLILDLSRPPSASVAAPVPPVPGTSDAFQAERPNP